MNKQEFLQRLERSLVMGTEEKSEVIRYYTEYFEEAGPENEQAVLEELGDPRALAKKLNAECVTESVETEETEGQELEGVDHVFNETVCELEEELINLEHEVQEAIDEAEMALREAEIDVRQAEKTTRAVFTSLKDIFGGGQTKKEIHEFSDYDMEPFHTIRVDVENCPVTVTLAENDQYGVDAKFVVGNQDEWEINVVDGTLTVKKHTSRRIRIHLGFSGNGEKNSEYVRIYLPKVTMDIVELTSSNASIQVEDVCTQTLIADTSNGSIEALLVGSEHEYNIHADTSNAKVYVDGQLRGDEYRSLGGAKEVRLDTSNGRIIIGFVSRS